MLESQLNTDVSQSLGSKSIEKSLDENAKFKIHFLAHVKSPEKILCSETSVFDVMKGVR